MNHGYNGFAFQGLFRKKTERSMGMQGIDEEFALLQTVRADLSVN